MFKRCGGWVRYNRRFPNVWYVVIPESFFGRALSRFSVSWLRSLCFDRDFVFVFRFSHGLR